MTGEARFVRTLSDWVSGTARLYRVSPPVKYRAIGDDYDAPPDRRADYVVVSYAAGVDETAVAVSHREGTPVKWLFEWRGRQSADVMLSAIGGTDGNVSYLLP